jgi:hypothetical protein
MELMIPECSRLLERRQGGLLAGLSVRVDERRGGGGGDIGDRREQQKVDRDS